LAPQAKDFETLIRLRLLEIVACHMLKVSVGKHKFINMRPSWMGTAAWLLG